MLAVLTAVLLLVNPPIDILYECLAGPDVQHVIHGDCLVWDYDGDQDVDLRDLAEWFVEWEEPK